MYLFCMLLATIVQSMKYLSSGVHQIFNFLYGTQEYSQALSYLRYPELKTQSWIQFWNSILSREKKNQR